MGLGLQAGAAPLTALLVAVAPAAAQSGTSEPWTRVPALPPSCDADDGVVGNLTKAIAAADADLTQQKRINADIEARFAAIDGGARSRSTQADRDVYKDEAFRARLADFDTTVEGAWDPVRARIQRLIATKAVPSGAAGWKFANAADEARYRAWTRQMTTDYDRICEGWFGTDGFFHGWFRAYKAYLVNDVIPPREAIDRTTAQRMAAVMGSAAGGYRSTAALEAVRAYMLKAAAAYAHRRPTTAAMAGIAPPSR